MSKPDPEKPVSGLRDRAGEAVKVGESETPSRTVPCRQCGAPTEMLGSAVEVWRVSNRKLKRDGREPLQKDEVVACGRQQCRDAEHAEQARRAARERNETQAVIDAVERGETAAVPPEIVRWRPGDHARIQTAIDRRRAGNNTDEELG